MKFLVASDIHGSKFYIEKVLEKAVKEQVDKIVLLGDLYYHGPRNPLPEGYAPKEVCNLLNLVKDKLLCVKGNCDAEVDEMISEFKFKKNIRLKIGGKKFFFTHGHKFNIDNIPANTDILVYGHFHTGFIKEKDGVVCVNAGSVSLPKNDTQNSFLIIDEKSITLKDFDDNIISQKLF